MTGVDAGFDDSVEASRGSTAMDEEVEEERITDVVAFDEVDAFIGGIAEVEHPAEVPATGDDVEFVVVVVAIVGLNYFAYA